MSSLLPVGGPSQSSSVHHQSAEKPVLTLFQQYMSLARERIKMLQPELDEPSLQLAYNYFEEDLRKDITAAGLNPDSIEAQESYIRNNFQIMKIDPEAPDAMQQYVNNTLIATTRLSTTGSQMEEKLSSLIAELQHKLSDMSSGSSHDVSSAQDSVDFQQMLRMVADFKDSAVDASGEGQEFSSDMDPMEERMFKMLKMFGIDPLEMMQQVLNPDPQSMATAMLKNFQEAKREGKLDELLQMMEMNYKASEKQYYSLDSPQGAPPQIVLNLRKCELEAFKIIKGNLEASEWEEFQNTFLVREIQARDDKLLHKVIGFSLETLPDFVRMAYDFDMNVTGEACLAHLYENRENVHYQSLMQKPDFAESIKKLVLVRESKKNEEMQEVQDSRLNVISQADINLWLAGFLTATDRMAKGAYWDERLKSILLSSANVIPLALLAARYQLEGLQTACQGFLTSSLKGEGEMITISHLIFKQVEVCQKLLKQLVTNDSTVKWLILTPNTSTTASKLNIVIPGFKKLKDLKMIAQKDVSHPIAQTNVADFLRVFLNRDWQDLTTVGFNCWIDEQTGLIHYESDKPRSSKSCWQEIYVNFKVNAGKWEISIGKPQNTPVWDDAYQKARQAALIPFKAAINRLIQKTGGHSDCKDFSDLFIRLRTLNQSIVLKKSDKAAKEEVTESDLDAMINAAFEELYG